MAKEREQLAQERPAAWHNEAADGHFSEKV